MSDHEKRAMQVWKRAFAEHMKEGSAGLYSRPQPSGAKVIAVALQEAERRSLIYGIACACAEIVRSYDQPTMAVDIVAGFGYSYSDLRKAGVDEYDLKSLRKEMLNKEKPDRLLAER